MEIIILIGKFFIQQNFICHYYCFEKKNKIIHCYIVQRRVIRMNSNDTNKDDISKCKLARFGNKKVVKYSDEYRHQRLKNNESVKNSRLKAKRKQKETENRMNKLAEENRLLNERVNSLMKELQVLRSLYKELGHNLPMDAVKALERINIY